MRQPNVGGVWLWLKGVCLSAAVGIGLLPAPASAQSNPIVIENQQPGTSQWQIPWGSAGTDAGGQIKGYASATSVDKGETLTFYVSVNPSQTYTIDVYRVGWYQGLGGRLMQHIGPLSGVRQPTCPTNPTTGMIECHWAAAYTLVTQTSWTSGIYLALMTNAQRYQNYIIFVVRDDGRTAALLYQQPVTTYQAYNDYPYDGATGKSLYNFNSYGATTVTGGKAAAKVSFDRPYMGDGTASSWGQFFSWEISFLRWLEKSGYDVAYATDVDTHANGSRLLNYRGFLSVGHDEYWSKPMYDAVVAARDAGVNLAFFGANAVYTQARFETSSSGVPNRVLVVYRNANLDPIADPSLKTVNWRDPPLNRPEQALIGVQYTNQVLWRPQYDGYVPYIVTNSGNWVYAGTGFKDGDSAPGIVGYEVDRWYANYAQPNAVQGTYALLSNSPFTSNSNTQDYGNSSIYQAPSGAWVFGAGTMGWGRALDNFGGFNIVDARIQRTTANILDRFVNAVVQPDFSLAASPASQTVSAGGSTSYTVTISPTGGFTGQVSLSVSGLPSGASGSFTPNPATTSSTLALTTSASTPDGTYALTIAGVSGGSLTHTTTVSLVVNTPPDFTLSASPSSLSVAPGGSTSYTVAINPTGGFTGQVSLSVSGLPSGASGSFTPNPATTSSTLALTTSASTPGGTYTLTITGVSGKTHSTTVSLTVASSVTVTYDNRVSSGIQFGVTTVTTPAFTIGSGTNRAAMIMVAMSGNRATNITASLGGVNGTVIPGTDSGTTAAIRTLIFQVIGPPSGSQTAAVSWTNGALNVDVGVITVSGADRTTPCTNGTFAANDSTPSATTSVTVTSASGDLTASVGYTANAWTTPFTNRTLKWGVDSAEVGGDIGPATGTTTHTWTDQYFFQSHAVSGANFKAAGTP